MSQVFTWQEQLPLPSCASGDATSQSFLMAYLSLPPGSSKRGAVSGELWMLLFPFQETGRDCSVAFLWDLASGGVLNEWEISGEFKREVQRESSTRQVARWHGQSTGHTQEDFFAWGLLHEQAQEHGSRNHFPVTPPAQHHSAPSSSCPGGTANLHTNSPRSWVHIPARYPCRN